MVICVHTYIIIYIYICCMAEIKPTEQMLFGVDAGVILANNPQGVACKLIHARVQ